MLHSQRMVKRSIAAALIIAAALFGFGGTVLGADWTGLGEQDLVALEESQMEDLRGGYLGFYFSITFSGFWDTQGNQWSNIGYEAGIGEDGQSGQITLTAGETSTSSGGTTNSGDSTTGDNPQFTTTAILGGFNGGQGLFQVNQVPGSNNIVHNGLILNLTIYNISESQAPAVMESLRLMVPSL